MSHCADAEATRVTGRPHGHDGVKTVLVVEDEGLICELMAEALAAEGFRVLTADDADLAAELLACEAVDLLFTDIDLARGTSGLALARHARARRPDLPVVYASGGCQGVSPEQTVPGSVYIAKPYRPTQVCDLVSRMTAG